MKDKKVINLHSEEDIKESLKLEIFELTLNHEYRIDGARIKIEDPVTVQMCMPIGEFFGIPKYNKADIIRDLTRRMIEMEGKE